jgi:hypothetical protein
VGSEVLFPQAGREEVDLQGGRGIDALEHLHEIAVGSHALQTTGRYHTVEDADLARAHFCPTE